MDLSYRRKITKTIIYILIIAAAAIIQNTNGLTIEIGGARCFLLLPVTIMIGMGEDEGFAGILGLIGGLFWDLNSAVHFGFNAAFMCISCFCCAALVTYIIRNTFISNFVFSTLSAFAYAFLYWLFFIIIKGVHGAELSLFSFYLPSAIYTMFTAPFIWFFINWIKKKLDKPIKA
ncbi:MAG: hypothetical protein K2I14_00745 [Eubacterium sp.]|nr:hypothetical protein [Eubacterium sp.]